MRFRFPNSNHYGTMNPKDFKADRVLRDFVFGWYGDIYVEVSRIEYNKERK